MTVKEAWDIVSSIFPNTKPERINEFDDYYNFAIRPAGSMPGMATGMYSLLVNKRTRRLEDKAFYPGDPRVTKSKYWKMIDPSELTRAS